MALSDSEPKDAVCIRDLVLRAVVCDCQAGDQQQEITANIRIGTDLSRPGLSDHLNDSIDYSLIKRKVLDLANRRKFPDLSLFAESIATISLEAPGACSVEVQLERFDAYEPGRRGIRISRTRRQPEANG